MNNFNFLNKFEYRQGNIFEQNDLNYIAHQCNCFHCMNAGIAGQIAKLYPQVAEYDKYHSKYGDLNKLGTIQIIPIISNNKINFNLNGIINMYSQYYPGHYKTKIEYFERLNAIEKCLNQIKIYFEQNYLKNKKNIKIGFPYLIGCGISGLKEKDVLDIFSNIFNNNNDSFLKIIFIDFNNKLNNFKNF